MGVLKLMIEFILENKMMTFVLFVPHLHANPRHCEVAYWEALRIHAGVELKKAALEGDAGSPIQTCTQLCNL